MIGLLAVGLAAAAPATWAPAWSLDSPHAGFGRAVAVADLDCDGWAELIVSSPEAVGDLGERQGVVEVFPGSAGAWGAAAGWTKWGSATGRMGEAIAVGDADGDGCSDLAVGEPGRNAERGALVVFLGDAAGLPLDPPDFSTSGGAPGDVLGTGLLLGVDGDGDGRADLVYGVPGWGDDAGLVAVHAGPGLPAGPTLLVGGEPGEQLGWGLAAIDLDASGTPWVLAGGPGFDSGLGRLRAWRPGDTDGLVVTGDRYDARFGERVVRLGDVDGDGRDEVGVCAPSRGAGAGQLTVWGLDDGALALHQTLDGPGAGAAFCEEALGGFDLDADGWPDLAVSLRGLGETWLYYGDGDGFEVGPAVVVEGGGGLASLGDWGGDVGDDLVVGVPGSRAVRVLLGRADADHDGVGDAEDCAPLDPGVGAVEVWYRDDDGDGFGLDADAVETCAPPVAGHSPAGGDCDDADADAFPGAPEAVGDGVDQDCDGAELCFEDADGDGVRVEGAAAVSSDDLDCAADGVVDAAAPAGDCDDGAASVHPGALDWPDDGVDQDCDGEDAALPPPGGTWRRGCGVAPVRAPWGWPLVALILGLRRRRAA